MLQTVVEPPSSPTMMDYTQQLTAFLLEGTKEKSMVSSFHHSDTSWDFNFDSFSEIPVYDEATEPVAPPPSRREKKASSTSTTATTTSTTSCYSEKLPWEEDKKKKKKDKSRELELELNSSWPCARHLFAKPNNNSNHGKSSKSKTNTNNSDSNDTLDNNSSHHQPTTTTQRQSVTPSKSKSCDSQLTTKGVRFAPTKVVRTHSLVLGDHPMCEDGLALQLGWDYEESKDIIKPLSSQNAEWNVPRWRRLLRPTGPTTNTEGPAKLLSLQERKKLLKEVAGCSEAELEKRRFCARFLVDYAFYEPPSSPPKQKKKAPPRMMIPNRTIDTTASATNSTKSFTNMKNFGNSSSNMKNSNSTSNSSSGNNRRGSSGCRDPPPPRNHETPIARPRRRSLTRRVHQPNYAARMA